MPFRLDDSQQDDTELTVVGTLYTHGQNNRCISSNFPIEFIKVFLLYLTPK